VSAPEHALIEAPTEPCRAGKRTIDPRSGSRRLAPFRQTGLVFVLVWQRPEGRAMTETRKLAADVVGYSCLMGEDEASTGKLVRERRR
jgi:hypothetical protein